MAKRVIAIAVVGILLAPAAAFACPSYVPGLLAGSHAGNPWTGGPNPGNLGISLGPQGLVQDPVAADAHWLSLWTGPDNSTLIYSGQIYLGGPTTFVEQNDDRTRLWIDGDLILSDDDWYNAVSASYVPPRGAGWYDFEVRFSNGGGGYGFYGQQNTAMGDSNWDTVNFGFGIASGIISGENALDYTYPEDPGDASLFRTAVIPEPATLALLGSAVAAVAVAGSRRRRRR